MNITLNDAWDLIPFEFVDDVVAFFDAELQPTHPLRAHKIFPIAKRSRESKYLIKDENAPGIVWVLDMRKKRRIRGKTCYDFKQLESQVEVDEMMKKDHEEWVQFMKEAGAWNNE